MHVTAENTQAGSAIRVIPTDKPIGADIAGVDLSKPLSDAQFKVIFDAWMDRQVLRFRGQDLSKDQLLRSARVSVSRNLPSFAANAALGQGTKQEDGPCLLLAIRRLFSNAESEALLDKLWAHATQPKYAWTHKWRVGDIVLWDNRCCMHYRTEIDLAHRRVMHRTTIKGDAIVAPW